MSAWNLSGMESIGIMEVWRPRESHGFLARPARGSGRGLDVAMFTEHTSMNMAIRHKHLKLDQTKIDTARRLLGLSTEQETVETALDLVIAEEPILRAHRKVKGVGGVVDLFGAR